jgi:hypothetical protein
MSGYNTVLELRKLEKDVDKLGFMLCAPRSGSWGLENGDLVAIKPKDQDSLPVYSRDVEIFTGTLDQLQTWLQGVKWARDYDLLLRLSDDQKRQRREQDERNRQLVMRLKNEKSELENERTN